MSVLIYLIHVLLSNDIWLDEGGVKDIHKNDDVSEDFEHMRHESGACRLSMHHVIYASF